MSEARPATAMNMAGAAADGRGWPLNRVDERGQQRPAQRKRQQHHPGEHILSGRDERHRHQNPGGNQSSRHGQSNDRPDPDLSCRSRAAGLLEVAGPGCCSHDRLP